MLYLQSIPSRPREGTQIHAIGAKNYHLPIYKLSPPSSDPVPAQKQKYRGAPLMSIESSCSCPAAFTLLRACVQALPTTADAKAAETGYKHERLDPAHAPYAKNMCRLILTRPSEGAGHVICPAGNVGRFAISA